MKRLFVLLAAVAAVFSVVASSAFAAGGTVVANNTSTCTETNNWTLNGNASNVDIPAGVFCYLTGEFKGNVTVEGYAAPIGATFDKNVIVNSGTIAVENAGAHFLGNLNITGSYGAANFGANALFGDWGPVTIEGNLNYTGNSVPLLTRGPVTVKGTFNYSGNLYPWDATQSLVAGQSSIS